MAKDRRDFLKDSALMVLGGAAGGILLSTQALAQQKTTPMSPKAAMPDMKNIRMNPDAKAVMPDGKVRSRAELMQELGLNPNTPSDAWLNIIGCRSNASALTKDQRTMLQQRGIQMDMESTGMQRTPVK